MCNQHKMFKHKRHRQGPACTTNSQMRNSPDPCPSSHSSHHPVPTSQLHHQWAACHPQHGDTSCILSVTGLQLVTHTLWLGFDSPYQHAIHISCQTTTSQKGPHGQGQPYLWPRSATSTTPGPTQPHAWLSCPHALPRPHPPPLLLSPLRLPHPALPVLLLLLVMTPDACCC